MRPFNLRADHARAIRDLDPLQLDTLVAVRGMVTRTGEWTYTWLLSQAGRCCVHFCCLHFCLALAAVRSKAFVTSGCCCIPTHLVPTHPTSGTIIPDLRVAAFRCDVCNGEATVPVRDLGRFDLIWGDLI